MSGLLYRDDFQGRLLLAYLALNAVLLAAGFWRRSDARTQRFAGLAFVALTCAAILLNRARLFGYAPVLNPDEALFAANAMRSVFGWTNWGMIDPTTSGPLNSIVLTWPRLYGGDITLYTGRLTAALLACGTTAWIYAAARKLMAPALAALAAWPIALFYVTTADFEFVHFSSEQLPVFLIAGSICCLISVAVTPAMLSTALAAFLIGLIPFAKLQGLPWAALLGVAALAVAGFSRHPRGRGRLLAVTVGFGLLPAALFIVPLAIAGAFDDFVKSYFVQQYLRSSFVSDGSLPKLVREAPTICAMMIATLATVVVAAVAAILHRSSRSEPWAPDRRLIALCVFAVVAVAVAAVSVALPRRNFPHYLQFLLPALSLLGIAALAVLARLRLRGRRQLAAALMIGAAALSPSLAVNREQAKFAAVTRWSNGAAMTGGLSSARSLAWLRPQPGDTMVCWGWRPECHVDGAMKSATRDATNENQLYATDLRPYFRSRFIADFLDSKPDFVIDYVTPRSFVFNDAAKYGVRTFPEFDRLIATDFDPMSRVDTVEACPRLYVRKARSAALSKALVAFGEITGPSGDATTPRAIDDRSTFETCGDYWLLPKGTTGTLTIRFAHPSTVKSVLILNTSHGIVGGRAAERLRVSLQDAGRSVASREVILKGFPRWTAIEFDSPQFASAMTLDILSYRGEGGGLNEVKVYAD